MSLGLNELILGNIPGKEVITTSTNALSNFFHQKVSPDKMLSVTKRPQHFLGVNNKLHYDTTPANEYLLSLIAVQHNKGLTHYRWISKSKIW